MKRLILLLTMGLCTQAFAGAELPFPFDRESEMTVLSNHQYSVQGTTLTVQVKVYQDPKLATQEWAKVWVRGEQDFVFDREWGSPDHDTLAVTVHIDASEGKLQMDLSAAQASTLTIEGQVYTLVPIDGQTLF